MSVNDFGFWDSVNDIIQSTNSEDPVVLERLSKSKNLTIMYGVSNNPNASKDTLDYLSMYSELKENVAGNQNTSEKTLDYLSRNSTTNTTKYRVAENPNTSKETLSNMYNEVVFSLHLNNHLLSLILNNEKTQIHIVNSIVLKYMFVRIIRKIS